MDFNFSDNFSNIFNNMSRNGRNYFKTDLKYYLIFLSGVILFFSLYFLFIFPLIFIENFYFTILLTIGLFLLSFLIGMYYLNWFIVSKAYHVLKLNEGIEIDYKKSLEDTKKYRLRSFIGMLITAGLAFIPIFFILSIFVFSLFSSPEGFLIAFRSNILLFNIIYLGVVILLSYLLIPLQIYPTLLTIEPDLGYVQGIKRSFNIISGWKTKLKFILLMYILQMIVNFFSQIIIFGLVIVIIMGFVLMFVIFQLNIEVGLIFIFVGFSTILIAIITIVGISQSIVTGSLYGQAYVSLARPELLENKIKKTPYYFKRNSIPIFCSNCGFEFGSDAKYCTSCGREIL